jgi:hypothetical protein
MTDVVRYRLPLGWLGDAVHRLRVRRDIEAIFDFRWAAISRRFGARIGT